MRGVCNLTYICSCHTERVAGVLLVSVSGICDRTLEDIADFTAEMDRRSVPVSFLVAPRLKGKYRLLEDRPTVDWLAARRSGGDAIVLNGYDQAATKKRREEFAALPAHEANLRLMAADRVMEQTGLRTRLFAAPGWIASAGAVEMLPRNGFRLNIGLTEISDLVRGTSVRARVLGIGEGFLSEPWWCRMLVMSAARTARRDGVVRVAIAAKHLRKPGPRQAMIDAIDLSLLHNAEAAVYQWSPNPVLHRVA